MHLILEVFQYTGNHQLCIIPSHHFQAKKEKYEAALHRINEAFATIAEYRGKVDELVPQHTQALAVVTGHVDFVEKHRQQYIEVSTSRYFRGCNILWEKSTFFVLKCFEETWISICIWYDHSAPKSCEGCWNLFSWNTRTYLCYVVNAMTADEGATPVAKASAGMVLIWFVWNIPLLPWSGLRHIISCACVLFHQLHDSVKRIFTESKLMELCIFLQQRKKFIDYWYVKFHPQCASLAGFRSL